MFNNQMMTQQQQIALLQQMAQMQMAQMGNQQSQSPLNMMMPGKNFIFLVLDCISFMNFAARKK
jgi:hypothetical protein